MLQAANGGVRPRVGLLDAEPELGRRIPPSEVLEARRRSVVAVLVVHPGAWSPPEEPLGYLILQGLLARDEHLAGTTATELMGPGDLIQPRPGADGDELIPRSVAWTAFEPATVAVLDAAFLAATAPWPQIVAALLERSLRQQRRLGTHQAISQLARVEERLLLLFWHLAERWGRVVPGGVALELGFSHEILGRLVGAKRPSVTVALGQLAEDGRIERRADGWILLTGGPPEEACRACGPTLRNGHVGNGRAVSIHD